MIFQEPKVEFVTINATDTIATSGGGQGSTEGCNSTPNYCAPSDWEFDLSVSTEHPQHP